MKTLVARLLEGIAKARPFMSVQGKQNGRARQRIVGEEEILIAKGREQFQRLLEKGLSIPIATI